MSRLQPVIVAAAFGAAPFAAPAAAAAQCPRAEVVEVMPKASSETRPVRYRSGTIHVSLTPLSTLEDIVKVGFEEPWAILLTFKPEVGERMERLTAGREFPMAFVVGDDALVSVILVGGYGIGKQGLQVSLDDERRARGVADRLSRCVALRSQN